MQDKILEYLKKKQGYISGEELAERLKVTRQALWKHIQELKDLGYDIEAVPHLGYKLISLPDRLYDWEVQQGLGTKILGRKILYFESLGSTMDMASKLGLQGASEGTVIIAETQTKGRGRLGRFWSSPKRSGLYFSLLLRPKIPLQQVPALTLLTAASICEALLDITGVKAQIKWPNDILLAGRKLGGILTELSAETDAVNYVSIGVGLNVNTDKKSLLSGATSLREEFGRHFNRAQVLRAILEKTEVNYLLLHSKGKAQVLEKWKQYSLTLGKRVRVSLREGNLEGEALDIDAQGSLLVRKDSGVIQRVTAGDVTHCR